MKKTKTKTYNSLYQYRKDNLTYVDRYGDAHYKRKIDRCVTNRYGDVVKVYTK